MSHSSLEEERACSAKYILPIRGKQDHQAAGDCVYMFCVYVRVCVCVCVCMDVCVYVNLCVTE